MASSRGLFIVMTIALVCTGFMRSEDSPERRETGVYAVVPTSGEFVVPAGGSEHRSVVAVTNLSTRPQWITLEATDQRPSQLTRIPPVKEPAVAETCTFEPRRCEPSQSPSKVREFKTHTGDGPFHDPRFFTTVNARLVGSNSVTSLYLHPHASSPNEARIGELLSATAELLPAIENRVNRSVNDIDGDGRFCILLVPRPARNEPIAFVRPTDFSLRDNDAEVSNRADMMYLSCEIPERPYLDALFAHEFAHALRCSAQPDVVEEDWLHEGIAHAMEAEMTDCGTNTTYRMSRFLEQPHRYPLVVEDYLAAGLYREHGCRGATILFMDSLARSPGRSGLLHRLVRQRLVGTTSVSMATSTEFPALMRSWTAQLLSSPPNSIENFVLVGPRAKSWDGTTPHRVRVAGTATVFVELPDDLGNVLVGGEQQASLQVSQFLRTRSLPIRLTSRRDGSDLIVRVELPRSDGIRLTINVETSNRNRVESFGKRVVNHPQRDIEVRFPIRGRDEPLVVKAFAEFTDGSFEIGRCDIAQPVQLTEAKATRLTR